VSELLAPGILATNLPVRLRRNAGLVLGITLLVIVIFAAIFAPVLDSHGALEKHVQTGLDPFGVPLPPSTEFPLGTDMLGRCQVSRLLLGARLSFMFAVPAALMAVTIGVVVGTVAGYAGGIADAVLMRLVDFVLAFPFILLIIALAAIFRGPDAGAAPVLIVLAMGGWVTTARVIRSKVLSLREREYVLAARALGAGHLRILANHIVPNLSGSIAVLTTMLVGDMLLAESALSFLGLGAPPPMPSWGRMLCEGQSYVQSAPWLIIVPGAAILLTVLAGNLVGEGLRAIVDPTDRRFTIQAGRAP